jgi:hypothetical protein
MQPTQDAGWVLTHEGYNVLTESAVEPRFALANGFLDVRGARSVSRGPTWVSWLGYVKWASWPRCYVAGLIIALDDDIARVPTLFPTFFTGISAAAFGATAAALSPAMVGLCGLLLLWAGMPETRPQVVR